MTQILFRCDSDVWPSVAMMSSCGKGSSILAKVRALLARLSCISFSGGHSEFKCWRNRPPHFASKFAIENIFLSFVIYFCQKSKVQNC